LLIVIIVVVVVVVVVLVLLIIICSSVCRMNICREQSLGHGWHCPIGFGSRVGPPGRPSAQKPDQAFERRSLTRHLCTGAGI
jgi:hypothetical protein